MGRTAPRTCRSERSLITRLARSAGALQQRNDRAVRSPLGAEALLLVAAVIAATCSFSTTSAPYNMAAILIGAPLTVIAIAGFGISAPRLPAVAIALVISLVPQWLRPPSPNIHQTGYYPWSVALGVAAVLLALLSTLPQIAGIRAARAHQARPALLYGSLATMVVAVVITIPGGANPQIDVWDIFQQSSAVVFHGVDPYRITHFLVPAKQTANCFNYLPASFLASWLGWLFTGDVRYSEAAVLLAGWLSLGWLILRRGRNADAEAGPNAGRKAGPNMQARLAAGSVLVAGITLAGSLRVAQQAWNESLILGFLLLGAALLLTRFAGLAWLPFALALATKQHVVLLVPVMAIWPGIGLRRTAYAVAGAIAVCAPWVLWDFGRFKTCTVDFFLDIQPRHDSISLWRFLPHGLQNVAVFGGLLVGYLLAARYLPRTVGGLLISFGVVLMGFDLSNKQTFENQWWLCAELLVCGLAIRVVECSAQLGGSGLLDSELLERREP